MCIRDSIKTGRGTAEQAVASLVYWPWDTPQMVELVRWMREYNAKPGKHPILSFVGLDMQSAMGAIGYLKAYVNMHVSTHIDGAESALDCVAAAAAYFRAKPDVDCRQKVEAIGKQLSMLKDVRDLGIARHSVTITLQSVSYTHLQAPN